MRYLTLMTSVLALSGMAHADTFTPPAGCTAFLTVQASNCAVEHYWICEGDGPGIQWSGEVTGKGLTYIGKIDNEAQWVDSFFLLSNEQETLISPAVDPASLTNLFETSLDTYDFNLTTQTGVHRVFGFDRIVERNVVIDGETLHRTEYSVQKTNAAGEVVFASEGSEYVSTKHRRFFSGYGDVTEPDPPWRYNDTPVEFIYPGDADYLSNTPKYGCDVQIARMPLQ